MPFFMKLLPDGKYKNIRLAICAIALLATAFHVYLSPYLFRLQYTPQEGDFIFQSLPHADLIDAIEGASQSPYSHVGMVIQKHGDWFVREAVGKVLDTPLVIWVARGRYGHAFASYRLKPDFQQHIPKLIEASAAFLGRPYDYKYALDDEKIYCSELIYKAMIKANAVRLGRLQKLSELNWKPYQKVIENYEEGPVPLDREMITPQSLSEAPQMEQVYSGYKK